MNPHRDRVLAAIDHDDWLTAAEIATRCGLARGTVTAILNRFGSAGPVETKYVESGRGRRGLSCLRSLRTLYRLRKDFKPENAGAFRAALD